MAKTLQPMTVVFLSAGRGTLQALFTPVPEVLRGCPPLRLGTYGKVLCLTTPGGQVRARLKFRDYDGRVRLVFKTGSSRAAAKCALKEALTIRRTPGGAAALTSGSRMTALAKAWLAADHGWTAGTERPYRSVVLS
jgi:hypothetical protein